MMVGLPQMSLAVVGVKYPNPDKAKSNRRFEIALCAPGEPVELRPEPKNKFDERAVAVFSCRGMQLGYLTAERCPRIGAMIREGREVQAVFQAASPSGAWIRAAFDGDVPVLPPQPVAQSEGEPDFYPDEQWGRVLVKGSRPRRARADTVAEQRSDEALAAAMIHQLFALEAQGARMPEGWREVRPKTLAYLNSVLTAVLGDG